MQLASIQSPNLFSDHDSNVNTNMSSLQKAHTVLFASRLVSCSRLFQPNISGHPIYAAAIRCATLQLYTFPFVNTIQQQTIYFGSDILWWQSILEGRTPVSLKLMNVHSCSFGLP